MQVAPATIWEKCKDNLQQELPLQHFNTWIRPLKPDVDSNTAEFILVAPNRFILDWVKDKFLERIHRLIGEYCREASIQPPSGISIQVDQQQQTPLFYSSSLFDSSSVSTRPSSVTTELDLSDCHEQKSKNASTKIPELNSNESHFNLDAQSTSGSTEQVNSPMLSSKSGRFAVKGSVDVEGGLKHRDGLNRNFTFESFVQGKSNQMGAAAAQQVAENPGGSYNPLFIYGGVGLGKTHLMHAVGNSMLTRNPSARVVYLHSERFVADMVKALQLNAINDFKRYYRSVDALLIDDIQFFAGKERSQEEFFHTFNALLEGNQQIILTCDRYPKVITNLEERLKSRFGWGLTVEIEPPELETRVAILIKRAEEASIDLPYDAAFFIAQRIRSNVRELEGALKRVIANASFTDRRITVDLVREALKDLLALQDKQVSITNIQRVVGQYYKVKVGDFTSSRRSRSVARPRQIAMALAKELTNYSLPEIGDAFGGRDHTTVLHACRKVKSLCDSDSEIQQDWKNLQRLLTA